MRLLLSLLLASLAAAAMADALFVTSAPSVPPPSAWEPNENTLFYDGFEYVVTDDVADDVQNDATFQAAGWNFGKAENLPSRNGAEGYLFTVIPGEVPGHAAGTFPGVIGANQRALVAQSISFTTGQQTDFYLDYGTPGDQSVMPTPLFVQYWMYPVDSPPWTHVTRRADTTYWEDSKLFYGCDVTPPPCSIVVPNLAYMWDFSETLEHEADEAGNAISDGLYIFVEGRGNVTEFDNKRGDGENQYKTSQNLNPGKYVRENQWNLVRKWVDTSTGNGHHKMWITYRGDPQPTKVSEWQHNVTLGEDGTVFTWELSGQLANGQCCMRWPITTAGKPGLDPKDQDFWIVFDDFCMATSEDGCPSYGYTFPN